MRIAFNPSTVAALTAPPNNKDITFDLRGRNIFARGVKFYGTDTNTWRDIKINNVSIGSHILDLRNGGNTTLTNTNGVVTINSTWRPVVDNLTSDSTTSSLSANQGRVLAGLISGKSDSDHNHDGRYVRYYAVTTLDCNNLASGLTAARVSATNAAHTNHSAYLYISDIGTPFQIQIPDSSVPYIYKRYHGSGGWSEWFKLNAGYADSAGSASRLEGGSIPDWGTLTAANGFTNVSSWDYGSRGAFGLCGKNNILCMQLDGFFYQSKGRYRVLDTSDVASLKGDLTIHQYLSATDATWWPLIWGGSSHANTSDSTGAVYKSHNVLSWQTSSQTLYATNIQTNNIKNLSIGGGIYWNPYVESATDNTDAASITLVRAGVAGGTTLVLSQMNDTNDTIQFKTNTAAKLYHNSYPILTTQNTYVNNHKGYINGTEITQVNNSDTVDGYHASHLLVKRGRLGAYNIDHETTFGTRDIQPESEVTISGKRPFNGWGTLLVIGSIDGASNHQLAFTGDNRMFIRCAYGTSNNYNTKNWATVALTSDNVASATKLQTPRSIWGQSFDGTANVDGMFSGRKGMKINGVWIGLNTNSEPRNQTIDCDGNDNLYLNYHRAKHVITNHTGGNLGVGIDNPTYKLHVAGDIYSTNYVRAFSGFVKGSSSDAYVLLGGGGHKTESSLNVANADTVDGYHYNYFTYKKYIGYNKNGPYNMKVFSMDISSITWTSGLLIFDIFSSGYKDNRVYFGRYEVSLGHWNNTDKNPTVYSRWIFKTNSAYDCVHVVKDLSSYKVDVYIENSLWDSNMGLSIVASSGFNMISSSPWVNLPSASSTVQLIGTTYLSFMGNATSATKVIVNQNIANDINYPLVWSNQNNSNTVTENQLYKSWSDLYYNPKNKRLTVGGSIYAAHFYESSDKTLKKNIKSILSSTNIPKIREFDWKDTGKHSYGFIAQELEEQGYDCLVNEVNGKKTVNYTATLALTVAKLQNLINIQNKKISNLTKELKALKYGRKKNS